MERPRCSHEVKMVEVKWTVRVLVDILPPIARGFKNHTYR